MKHTKNAFKDHRNDNQKCWHAKGQANVMAVTAKQMISEGVWKLWSYF